MSKLSAPKTCLKRSRRPPLATWCSRSRIFIRSGKVLTSLPTGNAIFLAHWSPVRAMLSWRGNSARRSIRSNFICAICLANSMYATGRRQSASTSKRSAEPSAALAPRVFCKTGLTIDNAVTLRAWRPRACHLPMSPNVLIEDRGRTANWLPRKHPSGVPGHRIAAKHVAFGPGSSAG